MYDKVDKLLAFFLLFLLSTGTASARNAVEDNYNTRYLSIAEGLPYSNVDGLFQDDHGFVWISTFGGGVARYDGNSFVTFNTKSSAALRSNHVTEVCQDRFSRLWVATVSGIDILDLQSMSMVELDPRIVEISDGNFINYITQAADGCIWFNARNCIYRVSFSDKGDIDSVDSFVCSETELDLRLDFRDIDGDGSVWTSIDGSIYRIRYVKGKGLQANVFGVPFLGENNKATSFLRHDNDVWVGTNDGLYRIDQLSNSYKVYLDDPQNEHSLSSNVVNDIALTPEGRVVVATMKGINIYDPMNDDFDVYSSEMNMYGSRVLASNVVRCLIVVGDQIWAGSDVEGISILQRKRLSVSDVHHREGDLTSLPSASIASIYFDHTGTQWVGTIESGLFRLVGDGYKYKFFNSDNSPIKHNSILSISEDPRGTLWVGSMGGGINLVDVAHPDYVRSLSGDREILSQMDNVNAFMYDQINDCMWICSRSGLFRYDYSTAKLSQFAESLRNCFNAVIDSHGRLWVAYMYGLISIDLHTMETHRYQDFGFCISLALDPQGELWVASFDNGLYKASISSSQFTYVHYTTEDGLPDDRMRALIMDGEQLWASTENGLARINTQTNSIESFSTADGLTNPSFYDNAACLGPDNALYFGHKKGMSIIRSRYVLPERTNHANILLTRVSVGGNRTSLVYKKKVKMHEKDRNINFDFADFSYGENGQNKIFSRLYPLDKEWRQIEGNSHRVRYVTLPGGSFHFQIRETDAMGNVLSEDECEVNVKPLFYKTKYFALLLILIIGLLVYFFIQYRTKAIHRNEQRLKEEVARQTQLLSEQKHQLEVQTEELLEQNRILLKQNESLAGHKMVADSTPAAGTATRDSKFMDKIMDVVRELYKDPELDVAGLCEAMCMSRSVLNNKIQDSFGQSIGQFIRTYRLNVAKEILTNNASNDMNISEVAYEVGFNDPKYFTRCFSKEFGIPPSNLLTSPKE